MKNITKFVIGTLVGGTVAGIVYKLFNDSKKEIEEEIEKEGEELKKVGIKPNANFKDLPGKNFVENVLYTLLKKTDNWEDDLLVTTDYENHDQTMWGSLRVMQRDEETVSIFVHIPPYLDGFSTLNQYREEIYNVMENFSKKHNIRYKLRNVGYWENISDKLTESGNYKHEIQEISENDCLNFSNIGNASDGLGRIVSHYYKNNCENLKKEQDLVGAYMFVEIILPLARNTNDRFGIDIVKMVGLLKTLTYDLNIMERDPAEGDVYPGIVFFPELNSFDTYYHTIKNQNDILVDYCSEIICTIKE